MNHTKFKPIALFPLKFQIHNPKESEFKIPYEFRICIKNSKAYKSTPTEKLTKIKFLSGTHMNPDKNSQN